MAEFIALAKIAAPYIATGSQVIGAFQTLQAGAAQSSMYQLQAKQAELKAARDRLQYEQQANMVFEKILMTNATAAARGYAGGVQGLSGSAKLIQERNERVGGRDIQILQEGARNAKSFGDVEAAMLRSAADQATTGSYFDAIGKIGTAAYMYGQLAPGSAPSGTVSGGSGFAINYKDPFMGTGVKLPRY